ncbi:MAG: hypothetical protein ACE15C_06625 [Phycisphaerae bacterium]
MRNVFYYIVLAYRWLIDRPSYMLLTAGDERLAAAPPRRFAWAWVGLVVQAIAWGYAFNVVWDWTQQHLSSDRFGSNLVQVAAVVATMGVWPFRRSIASLAEAAAGNGAAAQAVLGAVLVSSLLAGLLAANSEFQYDYFYPGNGCARTILLMPPWGAWAILITCQFCRPRESTEPAIVAFARGCGPIAATLTMAVPWVLTWVYMKYLGWWYMMMPASAIATAIGGGAILCRKCGGLSRRTLLAVNMLVQFAVLVAYLYVGRNR